MAEKKKFLLRLDAAVYQSIERWAADDLRSVNAQIEFLLADSVRKANRKRLSDFGDPGRRSADNEAEAPPKGPETAELP